MLNLIKYEFARKSTNLLILFATTIILNILAILIYNVPGAIFTMTLVPMIVSVIFLVEIVRTYSDDINKKSGYMLFMTPNSGYEIITSKIITIVLLGLILIVSLLLLTLVNGMYITYIAYPDMETIKTLITTFINEANYYLQLNLNTNINIIIFVLIQTFILTITFISTIYTAITIRKSVFSDIKFGGVLSFVIFILLNTIFSRVSNIAMELFSNLDNNIIVFTPNNINYTNLIIGTLPFTLTTIAFIVLFVATSGYLIEHKINL